MTIAPFIRIHNNITDKFKWYYEPSCAKVINLEDNTSNKTQIFGVGLNVGLLYFFTSKVSLELSLAEFNYVLMSDEDTNNDGSIFSIKSDLFNPNIGLKYYF